MSTRSWIGIQNNDGSIESIYCHFDGYVSHNGKILFQNYKDEKQIRKLIALKGLSSLGTDPERKMTFEEYNDRTYKQNQDIKDTCIFHPNDKVFVDKSEKAFYEKADFCIEYLYLYKNGKWYMRNWAMDNEGEYKLNPEAELSKAFKFEKLNEEQFNRLLNAESFKTHNIDNNQKLCGAKLNKYTNELHYEVNSLEYDGQRWNRTKPREYHTNITPEFANYLLNGRSKEIEGIKVNECDINTNFGYLLRKADVAGWISEHKTEKGKYYFHNSNDLGNIDFLDLEDEKLHITGKIGIGNGLNIYLTQPEDFDLKDAVSFKTAVNEIKDCWSHEIKADKKFEVKL